MAGWQKRETKSLSGPFEVILECDPALDDSDGEKAASERYRLYADSGDESHLKIRERSEPARFTCRHLRGKRRHELDILASKVMHKKEPPAELFYYACELALLSVSGIKDVDGGDLDIAHETDDGSGLSIVADASMADLRELDSRIPYEIGRRAWEKAVLSPK